MRESKFVPQKIHEINWDTWKFTEDAVLCFIKKEEKLMLIHKKTGLGKGKINAPGGRIERNEKPESAAVRECQEEIGLTPKKLRHVAELQFVFIDGYSLRGIVFFADDYTGTPVSTYEADPFWCKIDEIPYGKMWEDDWYWLPKVLNGERILGRFIFEKDRMLDHKLTPLR
ncbi:MAG: 8-oxo-dGTP diphosphatase [Fibrobacterota bacterium]